MSIFARFVCLALPCCGLLQIGRAAEAHDDHSKHRRHRVIQYYEAACVPPGGGEILLEVPRNAEVQINGCPTRSSGRFRYFRSEFLCEDKPYKYCICVTVYKAGAKCVKPQTTLTCLQSGDRVVVIFPAAMFAPTAQ